MSIDPVKLAVEGALAKQRHKHQDELEAVKDAHQKELREVKNMPDAKPPKRSRTNDRTEVIEGAIKIARTPDDARSVLAALRDMACAGGPFPQLLGHIPDEAMFKWDAGADEPPKFQSEKDALAMIRRHLKKKSR